jgi:uroporphyrinogen decarboxylase
MGLAQWWKGPVRQEPDFSNLEKVLRKQKPSRPTIFEFAVGKHVQELVAGPEIAAWPETMPYRSARVALKTFRALGYDYLTLHGSDFHFPADPAAKELTRSLNEGAVITDRASFDRYSWPDPESFDYGVLDVLPREMPEGMKLVAFGPGGVLENVIKLMGFDTLCYVLADDPDLAQQVFDHVGSRLLRHYQLCLQHDAVRAIMGNDDWGFKTQPMLAPETMRRYVVPWHRKIVAAAHDAGRLAFMHSCGQLTELMDDIIDDIRYDGKHSYEDAILPVEETYERYGRRLAVLGGIDVDFICRSTPEDVYRRSKAMLERSADRGGFALGTGNSVPSYVPLENYCALIAAAIETRY